MDPDRRYSLETAHDAARRDDLAAWVVEFLGSPGSDNAPLGATLQEQYQWWVGPIELPIDQLHRLAGPADQPVLVAVEDEDWWRDDVEDLAEQVEEGWEPPPVIVTWQDGQLMVEDGNHRLEGLRRAGEQQAWSVVGFDDAGDRDAFEARMSSR
jgi:hypothetical protein